MTAWIRRLEADGYSRHTCRSYSYAVALLAQHAGSLAELEAFMVRHLTLRTRAVYLTAWRAFARYAAKQYDLTLPVPPGKPRHRRVKLVSPVSPNVLFAQRRAVLLQVLSWRLKMRAVLLSAVRMEHFRKVEGRWAFIPPGKRLLPVYLIPVDVVVLTALLRLQYGTEKPPPDAGLVRGPRGPMAQTAVHNILRAAYDAACKMGHENVVEAAKIICDELVGPRSCWAELDMITAEPAPYGADTSSVHFGGAGSDRIQPVRALPLETAGDAVDALLPAGPDLFVPPGRKRTSKPEPVPPPELPEPRAAKPPPDIFADTSSVVPAARDMRTARADEPSIPTPNPTPASPAPATSLAGAARKWWEGRAGGPASIPDDAEQRSREGMGAEWWEAKQREVEAAARGGGKPAKGRKGK